MICPYCSFKNSPPSPDLQPVRHPAAPGQNKPIRAPRPAGRGRRPGFHARPAAGQPPEGTATPPSTHRSTELTTEIQERAEEELKDPDARRAPGWRWATLFLLHGEIEKSVNWFQQARQIGQPGRRVLQQRRCRTGPARGAAAGRRDVRAGHPAQSAARRSPREPRAPVRRSRARAGPGRHSAVALGEIQRALALEPKNPTLYNRLALIFCRERRYEEAVPPV